VSTAPLVELGDLHDEVYVGAPKGRCAKRFSDSFLKGVGPLGLAIWYQDDFGFTIRSLGKKTASAGVTGRAEVCIDAMEFDTQERVATWLRDTWGIECRLIDRGPRRQRCLVLTTAATSKLHALIAPFIHPNMQYKLLPQYRGRFAVEPVFAPSRRVLIPATIESIEAKPPRGKSTHRFDIEVEGTHNYFVDGVMVHNSPEVTPGGRALKFYASVRLDIRRVESIKDGADVVGSRTRVKVVKNKCVAAGTRVFDPTTGLTHRIEEIVEDGKASAVVATDKVGKFHIRPIVQRMDQGEHEVMGLHLRDGTALWVTADHKILTDAGWRQAAELGIGDRVARPRSAMGFGSKEPVSPEHARMLGYLIGDGCVTGKTPISFINVPEDLHADAACIASSLGCDSHAKGTQVSYSHRHGEKNGLLVLARWAGIWGHTEPEKCIPPEFFDLDVSAEILGNLLFGIWETDGWVSREQTGGIRCGFCTTSEQLAHQLHWMLLRWGIGSSVRVRDPRQGRPGIVGGRQVQGKLPCFEVRISGIDNVSRFSEALPMWGPRGRVLTTELQDPALAKHRGSQTGYLPATQTEPVLSYLRHRGVTAVLAATLIGETAGNPQGGLKQVLGISRLRRDRIQLLAKALESEFLREVLDEDLWYDRITAISASEWRPIYDIEVEDLHNFVANDVVVSNCAPPFKQAEFDIMYGTGISREGSLLDTGVELGLIKKSGAWFTYEGEQLGQGREKVKEFLRETPELMVEINERIRSQLAPAPAGPVADEDAPISLD
jgi:recombination protein RecA